MYYIGCFCISPDLKLIVHQVAAQLGQQAAGLITERFSFLYCQNSPTNCWNNLCKRHLHNWLS
jgi:hypothetical protein